MTDIKIAGIKAGTASTAVSATAGGITDSLTITNWNLPAIASGKLLIVGDNYEGTKSLLTTGLTNITATRWYNGATEIATTATLDTTGLVGAGMMMTVDSMADVTAQVDCDQGTITSPVHRVYIESEMSAGMVLDEKCLLGLVDHGDATHIAVATGNWTSSASWLGGKVPGNGARVLIPEGISITYNHTAIPKRLDWVRVDGSLIWSLTVSTKMLVENLIVTRSGVIEIGTAAGRVPSSISHEIIISDRHYPTDNRTPTDLDFANDTRLIGRGLLNLGELTIWAADRVRWSKTVLGVAPLAGDTMCVIEDTPAGWAVGDEIAIPGTILGALGEGQTEYRTLTSVGPGGAIAWSTPLVYDHDHHNTSVERDDLQPPVANLGSNVTIRSESDQTPAHRRGHTMSMHHYCKHDVWGVLFKDLGRTQKSNTTPAGTIHTDGTFRVVDPWDKAVVDPVITTSAMASDKNLQSRYPAHLHHCGFGKTFVDNYQDCVVSGSPGWGMVHHACEAIMTNNVIYKFAGAGMVSESGNEVGDWVGNCIFDTLNRFDRSQGPKELGATAMGYGDRFRGGDAFAMTGRAMRVNSNYAADCMAGWVFHHRYGASHDNIAPIVEHDRDTLDLKDLGGLESADSTMEPVDYPIVHWADNVGMGMNYSLFVIKNTGRQQHGLNIDLKRGKAWGISKQAFHVEYIGQYAFQQFEAIGNDTYTDQIGLMIDANCHRVSVNQFRGVDLHHGVYFSNDEDTRSINADYTITLDNPRYFLEENEAVDCTNDHTVETAAQDDLQVFTTKQTRVEPTTTVPFIYGASTGPADGITGIPTGLTITDSAGSGAPLPMPDETVGMPGSGAAAEVQDWGQKYGYWQIGGVNHVIFWLYFSDRLSAKPIITYHAIEWTGTTTGMTDNGAWTSSANPPVASSEIVTVTADTAITVDILALMSDVDGGTLTLHDSYYKPDHGRMTVDASAGEITYTPDTGFLGDDMAFVWVTDSAGHFTRLDLSLQVGLTAVMTIGEPSVTIANTAGNAFTLRTTGAVDSGNRRIAETQYSTDDGSTWRRLRHGYAPELFTIDTHSDGTAIASLDGINLRLRYTTILGDTSGETSLDPLTID